MTREYAEIQENDPCPTNSGDVLAAQEGPDLERGCSPAHLHQCLLHGRPVGHPPGALQHKVRVDVPFGLTIFRQGFPLVQFFRTPRRSKP